MSLFKLEQTADFEQLLDILKKSENPQIRKRAAEILGSIESETGGTGSDRGEVIGALVDTAIDDEDEAVRAGAIDALDMYGQTALEQLIGELSGEEINDVAEWKKAKILARGLSADTPELRMAAASGLGRIGEDNILGSLLDRVEDPDSRVRKRIARALGRIGSPDAVPALAERLHEDRYDVRIEVAYALADIGTDSALRTLVDLTEEEDEVLRRISVDALGNLGSVDVVEVLAEALSDDSESVRRTAMFSLVQLLSEAPSDESHDVREKIVGELGAAKEEDAVGPLIDILNQSDETAQRRNAAWLLGRIATDTFRTDAQEVLIETLADEDQMTAKFAATSLTLLEDDELEGRLLTVIENRDLDEEMRGQALFVLGKVGGEESRRRLERFVDSTESEQLRKRGFSALSKLGGMGAPGM